MMGLRHSKEKAKRYSSKRRKHKRQNPEGESLENQNEETYQPNACTHRICPCRKSPASSSDFDTYSSLMHQEAHKISNHLSSTFTNLRRPEFFKEEKRKKKEQSSPLSCFQQIPTGTSGWTLTFETTDKTLSNLVSSLHPHIESVHLDENKHKNIRVCLSDNPAHVEANNLPSNSTLHQGPFLQTSRICRSDSLSGDYYPTGNKSSTSERNQYYQQIPGNDGRSSLDNPKSSKHFKEAIFETQSVSRSRSRDRSCHGYCRRHSRGHTHRFNDVNEKSSRYHSPFDQQSFQEAMMLRLTELQQKSGQHAQMIRLETDSNCSSSVEEGNSDSEYSGDDDNRVNSEFPQRDCSQMFEPLSHRNNMTCQKNSITSVTVERHYHENELRDGTQTFSLAKPWTKHTHEHNNKKKNLTKKRFSSSSKHTHGYLRASAATQKGEITFPNTPKSSTKLKSSDGVQRHQHEHIHHHFYYNCKSGT